MQWKRGDQEAPRVLLPLVYDELRRLARHHLRAERSDHTLQSTALVHEAYLRLVKPGSLQLESRQHFFALSLAANAGDPRGLCSRPSCCET